MWTRTQRSHVKTHTHTNRSPPVAAQHLSPPTHDPLMLWWRRRVYTHTLTHPPTHTCMHACTVYHCLPLSLCQITTINQDLKYCHLQFTHPFPPNTCVRHPPPPRAHTLKCTIPSGGSCFQIEEKPWCAILALYARYDNTDKLLNNKGRREQWSTGRVCPLDLRQLSTASLTPEINQAAFYRPTGSAIYSQMTSLWGNWKSNTSAWCKYYSKDAELGTHCTNGGQISRSMGLKVYEHKPKLYENIINLRNDA